MHISKMYYLLALASLPALSNTTFAAINDFGNLQEVSGNYTALNTSFRNDAIGGSIRFDSTSGSSSLSSDAFINSTIAGGGIELRDSDSNTQFGRGGRIGHSNDGRIRRVEGDGGQHNYTPITSPVPEPETYAMIIAGLALIGFTARRRKQNP
jgi:hypothetical protein